MTPAPRPRDPRVVTGEYLGAAALTLLAFLWVFTVVAFGWPDLMGLGPVMQDFHAFHITGGLVWDGTAALAYDAQALRPLQAQATGTDRFMPWTYPPHFNLVAAALALLPDWAGYALYAGGGLVAYALVLRALAGRWSGLVLGAMFPAMAICLGTGQNGLWVGAVAGMLALLPGRLAGVPLGLLTLKPHFGPGLALMWLLRRDAGTIAVALAVTVALLALATLAQGAAIWPAFARGLAEAGDFLAEGAYRLSRMVSVHAAAASLGLPAGVALAAQVVAALAMLALVATACLRGWPLRHQLAVALATAPLVTPYAYDYDTAVVGVALALLAPDLLDRATGRAQALILLLCWGVVLASPLANALRLPEAAPLSLGAPVLAVLVAVLIARMRAPDPLFP